MTIIVNTVGEQIITIACDSYKIESGFLRFVGITRLSGINTESCVTELLLQSNKIASVIVKK